MNTMQRDHSLYDSFYVFVYQNDFAKAAEILEKIHKDILGPMHVLTSNFFLFSSHFEKVGIANTEEE